VKLAVPSIAISLQQGGGLSVRRLCVKLQQTQAFAAENLQDAIGELLVCSKVCRDCDCETASFRGRPNAAHDTAQPGAIRAGGPGVAVIVLRRDVLSRPT